MCVTDRHDMTLVVKVALNPNTTNQPANHRIYKGRFYTYLNEYGWKCRNEI